MAVPTSFPAGPIDLADALNHLSFPSQLGASQQQAGSNPYLPRGMSGGLLGPIAGGPSSAELGGNFTRTDNTTATISDHINVTYDPLMYLQGAGAPSGPPRSVKKKPKTALDWLNERVDEICMAGAL